MENDISGGFMLSGGRTRRRKNMDILGVLTAELGVKMSQVEAAVKLIDEGNTIPFIARYRKEATGSLNDEVLRNLDETTALSAQVWKSRKDAGARFDRAIREKLTAELERSRFWRRPRLWWRWRIYTVPFRPKRRTRASMAKERGLEPLADLRSCCR